MAASNGTLIIAGKSGNIYNIDSYVPDAVSTYIGFNPTGLAGSGSDTKLVAPEDGYIMDFITVAAPTAVGFTCILDNAIMNGTAFRHANLLSSLVTRQPVRVPVKKGQTIQLYQF